jgi:hypothetical protein
MKHILKVYFNDTQYIKFVFDAKFYDKYGRGQYALYELVAESDDDEHYATVYLPTDLEPSVLIGTIAHEATRAATDRHQTLIATMTGNIIEAFLREYRK